MYLDIKYKRLYSSEGGLIKELSCPKRVAWNELPQKIDSLDRDCSKCDKTVINTEFLNEHELIRMLDNAPETCLYISGAQNNIRPMVNE